MGFHTSRLLRTFNVLCDCPRKGIIGGISQTQVTMEPLFPGGPRGLEFHEALFGNSLPSAPSPYSSRWHAKSCLLLLFFFKLIYLWPCWVIMAACGLSLVAESGGYFSLRLQASHRGGFSGCRAQALGAWASLVAAHRLSNCDAWA